MLATTILLLAFAADDATKKPQPTITDADKARYYRAIAILERGRSTIQAAQKQMEAAEQDIKALAESLKKQGCEAVEKVEGLTCEPAKTAAK